MASQKCILIGLLIFFIAFIIIGICIFVTLSIVANSDQKETVSDSAPYEETTIDTFKSSIQVKQTVSPSATSEKIIIATSTFDSIKSSTLANPANFNVTSAEVSPKSDISTIKPNDTLVKGIFYFLFLSYIEF